MQRISLNGEWQLFYFPEGSQAIHGPQDLEHSGLTPLPALVPGNVELDLVRAGVLSDPFVGSAITQLRPYESFEWWYVRSFTLPAKPAAADWRIVFEGLDTLGEIWINGQPAGHAENMLIAHAFPVGQLLHWGAVNQVAVRLSSVTRAAARETYEPQQMSWEQRWEGLRIRKASHVWGWDILPRAVSAGLWRPVYLEPILSDGFDWIYFWTREVGPTGAVLGARFQVHTAAPNPDDLRVQFDGQCGNHQFHYEWTLEFFAGGCSIPIPGAQLWWPKGSGKPNLYHLTTRLYRGDTLLAERSDRIGLRQIEIRFSDTAAPFAEHETLSSLPARWDHDPDPQHLFIVRVNGEPIQIKGTNWVALDAFHSRDLGRIPTAMAMVDDLGCNMIRCWGGSIYEDDAFFARCDELGVLIWQDFAFACCAYPQDEAFFAAVRAEAAVAIERLRNHPSLALWCGDNENDMLYLAERLDPANNRLTREILPQMLHRLDPQRAYLPGSPYHSPAAVKTPELGTPEQHLWGPRGYYKGSFYTHHNAHFIGEIGYHGCPSPRSIAKFISPEQVWPWQNNNEWQIHSVYHWQKRVFERDRITLMANQIRELFGQIPENLHEFALASQITQAEAKKFFIESTRLRKWTTSGIIWWNLIDGWPQFSDAIVDYYFTRKLAYHYIRRSQGMVALIIAEPGPAETAGGACLPVIVCNDTLAAQEVSWKVSDADHGEILARGTLEVPANQNWQVGSIDTSIDRQRMLLLEWECDGELFGSHYLAGKPPFSLPQYCAWLEQISRLPRIFDLANL